VSPSQKLTYQVWYHQVSGKTYGIRTQGWKVYVTMVLSTGEEGDGGKNMNTGVHTVSLKVLEWDQLTSTMLEKSKKHHPIIEKARMKQGLEPPSPGLPTRWSSQHMVVPFITWCPHDWVWLPHPLQCGMCFSHSDWGPGHDLECQQGSPWGLVGHGKQLIGTACWERES